jgi:hypothetical protein
MRTSQLESSGGRFLSLCLQYALQEGWLSPTDLSKEFPPAVLMEALETAKDLRARLLVEAAGVHAKIAPKKSTIAAAEDLQIALDEGICTPESLLALVPVDEMVRHLNTRALWSLLTRDEFWRADNEKSRSRMLDLLETALEQKLLNLSGLVNSVTPEQLAKDLPRELLELVVTTAIQSGLEGSSLAPAALLDTISLETWLEHIALVHFWETTVSSEIVPRAGLGEGSPAAPLARKAEAPDTRSFGKKKKPKSIAPPEPEEAAKASTSSPPPSRSGNEAELQARAQAIAKLTAIDRLPTDAVDLRTPVLLGLESVYGELLKASSDEDRQELLEDAFPNPAMLSEAMLAMAVTKDELVSRGADTDALIQLVLFEERRRAKKSSAAPTAVSPPAASQAAPVQAPPSAANAQVKRAVTAPPLPQQARRVSAPPPPLPGQARNRS